MAEAMLALTAYAVAIAMPLSAAAWGTFRALGRQPSTPATLNAGVFFVVLVLPPILGLVADQSRAPATCAPSSECYDYILWWMAIPIGVGLALVQAAAVILVSRKRLPVAKQGQRSGVGA